MSLLSADIAKKRKLSLRDKKLPTQRRKRVIVTPQEIEKPPTDNEVNFNEMLRNNPILGEMVERLDLVDIDTGEKVRTVENPVKETTSKEDKIKELTERIIKGEESYSREDIIEAIIKETGGNRERAENGFNLMIEVETIEATGFSRYYLKGSIPF